MTEYPKTHTDLESSPGAEGRGTWFLLSLLSDIRAAVGDPSGKLMQDELVERCKNFREALEKLRDCDWVITLPDRMDAVRNIARQALESPPASQSTSFKSGGP